MANSPTNVIEFYLISDCSIDNLFKSIKLVKKILSQGQNKKSMESKHVENV
jgi:hypothetical protein